MTSSIFGPSPIERAMQSAKSVVGGGTPEQAYQRMMQNPDFQRFMGQYGKSSPQQLLMQMIGGR